MIPGPFIKVYNSFGSTEKIMVMGHVFKKQPEIFGINSNLFARNFASLIRLFLQATIPNQKLKLSLSDHEYFTQSEFDGFYRFDCETTHRLAYGWHNITVSLLAPDDKELATGTGKLYIPEPSQYAYISDIDDTIMKSYSATIFKRLYELLSRNPVKRRLFDNTSKFYNALAESNTNNNLKNTFFYVSSSEWNLYEYLRTVFNNHELPVGIYLLNSLKHLSEFVKTGRTGHEGKLMRIARIIIAFPEQKFVLLGDNSQKDPEIYAAIAEKYPLQINAVLIRNVRKEKVVITQSFLKNISHLGIHTKLFATTQEAIAYSREIGLIHDR